MTDERYLGGFKNRLIVGANLHNGEIDNRQYLNNSNSGSAIKGALQSSSLDKSENASAYIENSFFFLPSVALVAGTQFLHATRERTDRFLSNGDQSGQTEFDVWSPKVGLLWNVDPTWQVYANVSRSAEVPSFGEGSNSKGILFTDLKSRSQPPMSSEPAAAGRTTRGTSGLSGRDQERAAMSVQRVRQLRCR